MVADCGGELELSRERVGWRRVLRSSEAGKGLPAR